jgi:hypothetical protein
MTGDRKATSTRRASKDVAQFAPNFTVYVLPPDVVCLYSEDRKFFLHGELYCALASAIGKGGKSLPQLAIDSPSSTRRRWRQSGVIDQTNFGLSFGPRVFPSHPQLLC